MGCGGSRGGSDREIDPWMEWIPSYDINQFFIKCENVLKDAETLRHGWQDSLDIMYDISSVNFLKQPPVLMDAIKVWVWSLAALNGGDIAKCAVNADSSSPYLKVDIGVDCSHCHNTPHWYHENCAGNQDAKFQEALKDYIKTCIEGVKLLPEIIKNLVGMIEEAKKIQEGLQTAFSHLNTIEKAKAIGKVGKNVGKLTGAMSKLKALQPLVPEAVKNMEQVIKELPDVLKTANEVAKKAVDKKLTLPADIMQVCHPGPKYNDNEIKKMKAEAEKKRKAQEEEAKKKANLVNKFLEAKKLLTEKSEKK